MAYTVAETDQDIMGHERTHASLRDADPGTGPPFRGLKAPATIKPPLRGGGIARCTREAEVCAISPPSIGG